MSWGTFLSGECISVTAQELAVGKMETKSSIFCDCCLSCCDTVVLPPKIKMYYTHKCVIGITSVSHLLHDGKHSAKF